MNAERSPTPSLRATKLIYLPLFSFLNLFNHFSFFSLFSFFCLLVAAPLAKAYEPKVVHKKLTLAAFETLTVCGAPLNANLQQQVVLGNIAMDEGGGDLPEPLMKSPHGKMLFSKLTRIHNWHFYHPDKTSDAQRLSNNTDMSMARLWQAALTGLETASEDHKGYYLGALLHLIQDVTVPAHTVPVYHGPKIVAWKSEFAPLVRYLSWRHRGLFAVTDPIDKWPVSNGLAVVCPNIEETPTNLSQAFETLREATARQTLSALDAPISGCGEPWGIFWRQDIGHKYFSGYNQKIKPFDKAGDFTYNGRQCHPAYQQFINNRHQAAVDASAMALRLFQHHVSAKLKKSGS